MDELGAFVLGALVGGAVVWLIGTSAGRRTARVTYRAASAGYGRLLQNVESRVG
ncbi:MAG: hypothetical protein ACP5ID_02895 [Conexivisphaera sp.]